MLRDSLVDQRLNMTAMTHEGPNDDPEAALQHWDARLGVLSDLVHQDSECMVCPSFSYPSLNVVLQVNAMLSKEICCLALTLPPTDPSDHVQSSEVEVWEHALVIAVAFSLTLLPLAIAFGYCLWLLLWLLPSSDSVPSGDYAVDCPRPSHALHILVGDAAVAVG
jgi:hypothetical protein